MSNLVFWTPTISAFRAISAGSRASMPRSEGSVVPVMSFNPKILAETEKGRRLPCCHIGLTTDLSANVYPDIVQGHSIFQ
jgi:hypothetical protein